MDQYSVVCQWSDEDEGYIALVPELKGLSAFGETPSEAIEQLEIAKELYLKVFEEDGCLLPEPKKLPEFSGQLRIRIPKSLHAELSRSAEAEGVSLNTFIISVLTDQHRLSRIQKDVSFIKKGLTDTIMTGSFQQGVIKSNQDLVSTSNLMSDQMSIQVCYPSSNKTSH